MSCRNRQDINRRRQQGANRVENRLNALVAQGGTQEYREKLAGQHAPAQGGKQTPGGDFVAFQEIT